MPITDYSTSAASNTVLGTIPVGPGMERSKVNDAIQQLMADIAGIPSEDGASLIGFIQTGTGATERTVEEKLQDVLHAKDFGVTGDGVADDTAELTAALTAAATQGKTLIISGTPLISSTLTIPAGSNVVFAGSPGNFEGARPKSYIIKKNTGSSYTGVVVLGQSARLQGGGVVGETGNAGDNIQILGNDVRWYDGYSGKAGQDGVRIGEETTASPNTNSTILQGFCIDQAGRYGLNVTDGTGPADYANGNVGDFNMRIRNSGSHGIYAGNSLAPLFRNCLVETNTGRGIYISRRCVQAEIAGGDYEANLAGAGTVGADIYAEPTEISCTFTDAGDLVTATSHGLSNGAVIRFSTINTTTGISTDITYFVISATANTFQVAASSGGAAIALTNDGTGVFYNIGTGAYRGGHKIHPTHVGAPVVATNCHATSICGPNLTGFGADSGSYPAYAEGTFTPILAGSSTAGSNNYTRQNGYWTKNGRKVEVFVDIIMNGQTVAMVGDLTIPNLPFRILANSPATIEVGLISYLATNASRIGIGVSVSNRTATFQCYGPTDATQFVAISAAQGANFVASGRIACKITYLSTD